MSAEAILAAVPGQGCWTALAATEHADFELYAEFPEQAA